MVYPSKCPTSIIQQPARLLKAHNMGQVHPFTILLLSLLILPPNNSQITTLQLPLQILINRKRNRLPRRNPHNPRRNALIKRLRPFLFKHIARDIPYPTNRRLARLSRRALQPRLDSINGRITERAHRAGYQADEHRLIGGQFFGVVGRLCVLQELFELRVGGEIDGLVCALAEGGQGDATVEGAGPFFAQDGVAGVRGVAVFGHVERVCHGVVLGLQADFDHFHWGYDGDGFGHAGGKTGYGKGVHFSRGF